MTEPGGPGPRDDRHRTLRWVVLVLAELVGAAAVLVGVLTDDTALLGVAAVVMLAAAVLGVVNVVRDSRRR